MLSSLQALPGQMRSQSEFQGQSQSSMGTCIVQDRGSCIWQIAKFCCHFVYAVALRSNTLTCVHVNKGCVDQLPLAITFQLMLAVVATWTFTTMIRNAYVYILVCGLYMADLMFVCHMPCLFVTCLACFISLFVSVHFFLRVCVVGNAWGTVVHHLKDAERSRRQKGA